MDRGFLIVVFAIGTTALGARLWDRRKGVITERVERVRIIGTPPGEAPEEVRRAWVGMVLPLAPGQSGSTAGRSFGVLTGPKTFFGAALREIFGKSDFSGYIVDATVGVDLWRLAIRPPLHGGATTLRTCCVLGLASGFPKTSAKRCHSAGMGSRSLPNRALQRTALARRR